MKIRSVCSAAASLVLAAAATAQPTPNVDLGVLPNPSTTTGTLTGFVAAQVQWIRFEVPADATLAGSGYLDIDTNGGTLTGGDSHIGLYRADGTFLDSNDDSGPGLYSMLSYGRTTPSRAGLAPTGNAGSAGSTHAGGSGAADITAGVYYLAVTGFGGNTYGAGFAVGTTHARTGDVAFRIDYVGNPSSLPPFCTLALAPTTGPVGTSFVATATVTPGSGPVSTGLAVSLNAANVDGGTVALLDDGVAPDAVAGDNIFTGTVTVGALSPFGAQTLTSTVSDAESRSSTCTATFTVVAPPPANDECAGAFAAVTGSNAYDTNGALTSSGNGSPCGAIGTDVWFVWNSGSGGTTTISTCGQTTQDTVIAVYANCGDTTALVCNDDSCGLQSSVSFCAAASTDYYIRIGDFAGGNPHTGTFVITQDAGGAPTVAAAKSPACGGEGTVVTITTQLSNAGCPAQTITSASADASAINAGSTSLLDDGVAPDATAGDGIFTGSVTVGAGASSGDIVVTTNFSGGGSATNNLGHVVPGADDHGDTPATATVVTTGPVTALTGVIADNFCDGDDADMFKINICEPANFSATLVGGASFDTQLFLFDANGMGVAFNDDSTGLQSTLTSTFTASLPAGDFYLAVSPYSKDAVDSNGDEIWLDTPFASERAPDGTGAANPIAGWNADNFNSGGTYSIAVTGVCPVSTSCHGDCTADFDDGSGTGTPDGGVTIDDLLYYLDIFEQGVICADVDDGSFTGTTDEGVTIDDLLYFLFRFEEGC